MVFREYTCSVLVVSANKEFSSRIAGMLPSSEYWPVHFVSDGGAARRKALENRVDIILINSPLPDESGIRAAADLAGEAAAGVVLFVKKDLYDEAYGRVLDEGVVVLPKPVVLPLVTQSLRILCAVREKFRRMEEKQATVEERIKEIRLVNRAKWLLIENEKMSEADAHHYIERLSMDGRITKKEAADGVIKKYG